MNKTLSTQIDDRVRATRSLFLLLRQAGPALPWCDGDDELALDKAQLLMVESLAAQSTSLAECVAVAAERTGSEVEELSAFAARLMSRSLIAPVDGPGALAEDLECPPVEPGPRVDVAADQPLVLPTPAILRAGRGGFEYVDHYGRLRSRLSAVEILASFAFSVPTTSEQAFAAQLESLGTDALSRETFDHLVERLLSAGLVTPYDLDDPAHHKRIEQTEAMGNAIRRRMAVNKEFDRLEAEQDQLGGPADRVKVLSVHHQWYFPPSGLGLLVAYAKAYDGGSLLESYDFRPRMVYDNDQQIEAAAADPSVALFSNYIWCHDINMERSALVKRVNPHSVTVHGGPNTPKYEADGERFFHDQPHVDITVHGEGEATFAAMLDALSGSIGHGPPDLSPLADVPGLSFRLGDRVIHTGDRDRIADLDTIPSAILTGLFDGFIPAGTAGGLSLETNRGCPYGCTFCDWGSATLSRIRKFDIDRVFAEIEWCARNQFGVGLTDANFGIFERDVEIAQRIADLKTKYGYPQNVGNNYAKNTVKHLSKIIEIFTEVGIVAEGKMSMQSMDEGTLTTVRRKNIKVEKYDDLSSEFGKNKLPMSVELMMGLPGSTIDTLRNDLQDCISRNVRANVFHTIMLPNSPMNDPDYREANGIVAVPGEPVRQTSTYTRDDWDEMNRLNNAYTLSENYAVLRYVAMYVRAETHTREIDFYEQLVSDARTDRERWPIIALTYQSISNLMVPPVSWQLFIDEVKRYLVDIVGLPDDDALASVLAVQHALQPARDRDFPVEVPLAHDVPAWHAAVLDLRHHGHRHDWDQHVRPLRSFGEGVLTVDDPKGACRTALGGSTVSLSWDSAWDLDSAVSRPRQRSDDEAADALVG